MNFKDLKISKFSKAVMLVFVVLVFAALLVPLICMSFAKTEHLSGSTELAPEPALITDSGLPNTNILADTGKYFEDHFAFRPQFVTANAILHYTLFNDTATSQVISGNNGYMFYSATLDDYFVKNQLSDNQLKIIAYNLSLVQQYCEEHGSTFCFMVCPNKNSVYAKYMPANYLSGDDEHNVQRLIPYLDGYGVNYCNLFDVINSQDNNQLYLKTDSHWNNKGALYATNKILQMYNKNQINETTWQTRNDFDGDLFAMTFPSIVGTEEQYYLSGYNNEPETTGNKWHYTKGGSVEDSIVSTKSDTTNDGSSLYMYRDSFANALIPYLGSEFSKATFSKLIPYDLTQAVVEKSKNVIIERAERQLSYLAQTAPIMPAPIANNDKYAKNIFYNSKVPFTVDLELCDEVSLKKDGNMYCIQGKCSRNICDEESIVIRVQNGKTGTTSLYKPFFTCNNETQGDDNAVSIEFCARLWDDEVDPNNSKISLCIASDTCIISSEVYHSESIFTN